MSSVKMKHYDSALIALNERLDADPRIAKAERHLLAACLGRAERAGRSSDFVWALFHLAQGGASIETAALLALDYAENP